MLIPPLSRLKGAWQRLDALVFAFAMETSPFTAPDRETAAAAERRGHAGGRRAAPPPRRASGSPAPAAAGRTRA